MPILILIATLALVSCVAPQGDTGNAAQSLIRGEGSRDAQRANDNVQRIGR